jgi:hypothetical protein
MNSRLVSVLAIALSFAAAPAAAQRYYSDEEVRRMIIDDSMRAFPNCPCPYSYAWNGRQCAGDSAYSKLGRSGPLCYPADVSHQDIIYYRQRVLNR